MRILCQVAVALLFGVAIRSAMAEPADACAQQKPKVVCNIASGCKLTEPMQMPACKASVNISKAISNASLVLGIATPAAPQPAVQQQQVCFDMPQIDLFKVTFKRVCYPLATAAIVPVQTPREKADGILARLDANPLDDAAQGEAREIIRNCNASGKASTPRAMFECSGFLVTPMVRLTCVGNGPCMPTPWKLSAADTASSASQWALEVAYDQVDSSLNDGFAYARPWIASAKDIQDCRKQALAANSDGSDERTIHCLTIRMGGKAAQNAMSCFKKYPNDPVKFAGCIGNVKLDALAVKQATCVLNGDSSEDCLVATGISKAKISECRNATPADKSAAAACLASLPRSFGPSAECVRSYRGDISLTAHCLSGLATIKGAPEQAALKCGLGLSGAGNSAEMQERAFSCLGKQLPQVAKYAQAIDKYKAAINCLQDPGKDLSAKAQCARQAGANIPDELKLAQCTAGATTGAQLAQCAGVQGADKVVAMERCLREASGDNTRRALCVGMQAGMNPEQRRVLECAATSKGAADGIVCIAGPKLPPQVAKIASCAANSQGSPAGTAICLAGPSMNAELRIAAECAATTGGEPISFASCAGGRLTMKELQQCVAGGFKAENGCFGENNEIVKYYKAQEALLREALKVVGLEGAYQNMLNDLKNGKLGENNEVTRVLRFMNDLATKPPAQTISNAVEEAKKAGTLVADGAAKLNEEVNKVQKQAAAAVENAMPKVPPVTAKTDLPGGGSAQVTVGPTGGTVTAGNNEVSVGSSPHVKVGGVCIGWGC